MQVRVSSLVTGLSNVLGGLWFIKARVEGFASGISVLQSVRVVF